jgi:hypothetical protein
MRRKAPLTPAHRTARKLVQRLTKRVTELEEQTAADALDRAKTDQRFELQHHHWHLLENGLNHLAGEPDLLEHWRAECRDQAYRCHLACGNECDPCKWWRARCLASGRKLYKWPKYRPES